MIVLQNYGEALKYFQKAAEKGWPNAQFQLGFMYYCRYLKYGYLI